jgi:predicted peroxiredoxin
MEPFSLCWHSVPSPISDSFPLTDNLQAVQNTFDILGGVLYILCVLMEGAIFLSHLIWLFRTRKIRAQAKAEGKTFDDIAEESRQQGVEFKFAERKFHFSAAREQTFEEDVPIETELELGLSIGKED